MITLLKGIDALDHEGTIRLVKHLAKSGLHPLLLLGTTEPERTKLHIALAALGVECRE